MTSKKEIFNIGVDGGPSLHEYGKSADFMMTTMEVPDEHIDDWKTFYPKEFQSDRPYELEFYVERTYPAGEELMEMYAEEVLGREMDEDDEEEYGEQAEEWFERTKKSQMEDRFYQEMREELSEQFKACGFDIDADQII